jgi:Tfp pilus assembly PilM family ATPase
MLLLKNRTFFNLFPTPEYLSLSNSGIVIAEDGIKFIELHHGLFGKGLTLSHFQKLPLPEGAVYGGLIYDPKDVAAALKEFKDKYGLTFTRATLPEEKAYLFSASIPASQSKGSRMRSLLLLKRTLR